MSEVLDNKKNHNQDQSSNQNMNDYGQKGGQSQTQQDQGVNDFENTPGAAEDTEDITTDENNM